MQIGITFCDNKVTIRYSLLYAIDNVRPVMHDISPAGSSGSGSLTGFCLQGTTDLKREII
jgi:hypothetical protein